MKLRGKGIACFFYGMGNTGKPNPASAYVELMQDGSANIFCGVADIGQGSSTVMTQIAAQELGIPFEMVTMTSADTGVTPEAGVTSACRQTFISGNAVRLAAKDAKEQLFAEAAKILSAGTEKLAAQNGYIYVENYPERKTTVGEVVAKLYKAGKVVIGRASFNPPIVPLDDETGQGVPYGVYTYGTMVSEVEVDTETGQVNVLKITAAQDAGKAINPLNVEGQIEGGIAIGLGFCLSEEIFLEKGLIKNPNFNEYLLPTALDMPDIDPIIVECPEPIGPFGANGVGEPSNVPVAASILNAIADAVGCRVKELPCTAERLFNVLQQGGN
jgi:CO/xanthine dehydrogenase Mo-binding subunit